MRRAVTISILCLASLVTLWACRSELPPLEAEGEHARVGSDMVGRICGGTLAWIDSTSEYVGEQLHVQPELTHDIYFVSSDLADEYCKAPACTGSFGVVVRVGQAPRMGEVLPLRETLAHELTHAYTRAMLGLDRRAFIEEGLADAIAEVHCRPSTASLQELLEVESPYDLWPLGGYCSGSNFVEWLLEVEGPTAVLAFHDEVERRGSAQAVFDIYEDKFGRSMQDDYDAHNRARTIRQPLDCLPDEAPMPGGRRNYRALSGTTDCSDPRVENDFANVERVFVSWRLTIGEHEAGPWQVSGPIGPDVESQGVIVRLGKNDCARRGRHEWSDWWASPGALRERKWLGPGTYTVQVSSPLDEPAVFDTVLAGPCRFGADDCRPGDRCDGQVCTRKAGNPLAVGAACAHDPDLGDPCMDAARCVGPLLTPSSDAVVGGRCVALCTRDDQCPAGQRCHAEGLCGVECEIGDPGFVCGQAQHCVQGWDGSPSVCMPGSDVLAQASDGCRADTHCPSGSVCDRPRLGAGQVGCANGPFCQCTQTCSLSGLGPACPADRPRCVADSDGRRATCQPDRR